MKTAAAHTEEAVPYPKREFVVVYQLGGYKDTVASDGQGHLFVVRELGEPFGTTARIIDCAALKPWPANRPHDNTGFEIEQESDEGLFTWMFKDALKLSSAGEQTFDGHQCQGWRWCYNDIYNAKNEITWWFDKAGGYLVRKTISANRLVVVPTLWQVKIAEERLLNYSPTFVCPEVLKGERVYPHSIRLP